MARQLREMARIRQRWSARRADGDHTTGDNHIAANETIRGNDSAGLASDQWSGATTTGTSGACDWRRSVVKLGRSNHCGGNEPDVETTARRKEERSTRATGRPAHSADPQGRSHHSTRDEESGTIAARRSKDSEHRHPRCVDNIEREG